MPNAMTGILKEAILMAGESVGNEIADEAKQERKGLVSYLQWAAIKHPPTYLQLLARVMSTQIDNPSPTRPSRNCSKRCAIAVCQSSAFTRCSKSKNARLSEVRG
jgi:hypothetical protein